jgi:hypothetical protein
VTHVDERPTGSGAGTNSTDKRLWNAGARQQRRRTVTYADAGVSIHAGEQAVAMLKGKVQRTNRPEVLGDLGGFAGLFKLDMTKYKEPVLASSTDGVGTKLVIAQTLGIHDTVGIDLVAMVVDDLVACGAEPLFLLDYIACGEVVPDRISEIGAGIADGCRYAGCALLGGETAEHPGVMRPDEYDISGRRRRRRARRDPRPAQGRGGRRGDRHALVRPARQRVLAGAARAAGRRPDAAGHGVRRVRQAAHARRGTAHPDEDLRPRLPGPDEGVRPAALAHVTGGGVPATWSACCPTTPTRWSTGPPGGRSPSSNWSAPRAASRTWRWRARSTWAWA